MAETWAILMCNASDRPPGANSMTRWNQFFNGADPGGAFNYWRDIKYGINDLSSTKIFGWFDLGRTTADLHGPGVLREQVFQWAVDAANAAPSKPDLAVSHVIAVVNASSNDHGNIGAGALFTFADSTPLEPTFMFHEMGHAMGLDHSFGEQTAPCLSGDNRPGAYCDIFDLMSAANVAAFVDAQGRTSGPGLSAPNLHSLGVLEASRIWDLGVSPAADVTLAALNRPDVAGHLTARFRAESMSGPSASTYYFEFRQPTQWDRGLAHDAVVMHEVRDADGLARLLTTANGGELHVGVPFSPPDGRVVVTLVNLASGQHQATISVAAASHPNFQGSPAAVSWGPDRLDFFGIGTNGHMYQRAWTGAAFGEWVDLQ
jgi:hypothetical protein